MWTRQAAGRTFTFHLAGINNQNFIMRDEETGSYWQQVSGRAISGPMQGAQLTLVSMDELSFSLWKSEAPGGSVLAPVAQFASEYETKDWEQHIGKLPTVVNVAGTGVPARETMLGLLLNGAARAFPLSKVLAQSPLQDTVGGAPVVIVVGPDKQSIRAFRSQLPGSGKPTQFYQTPSAPWELMDSASASHWNFRGCATSGPAKGQCLTEVQYLKDYWFDWHNYHPGTTVYSR